MISFGGLASGIDSQGIIQALTNAQRVPIRGLEAKKTSFQAQISTIGKMTSALNEFKTLMEDMKKTSSVLAFNATVGDEDLLSASIDGSAARGTYELTVHELARGEKNRSGGYTSDFAAVKAGTITLTAAGHDPVDVTIDEGDTLTQVVDKINASGARVDASIVRDGTSSYLQITASDSGHAIGGVADDALVISESYSGADGGELGLTQVVQARNASVEVDGLMVEQRSNVLTDVINDVTLTLKAKGTTSLDVAPDRDGTREQIRAFVDKFNEIGDLVKSATTTRDGGRAVNSDPTLLQIRNDLRAVVGEVAEGLGNDFSSLSRVGIRTTATGGIEINASDLDAAIDKDMRSVGLLFTQEGTGVADRMLAKLERYIDTTDGALLNRTKSLNSRIDGVDTQIGRLETRIDRLANTLQRQFTAMEQTISTQQMQGNSLMALLLPSS